jgi:hypothetical protein
MNREILIEALEIAKDNFDYDNEGYKADQVRLYLIKLYEEEGL